MYISIMNSPKRALKDIARLYAVAIEASGYTIF